MEENIEEIIEIKVTIIGSPGVGKTHLATAIGTEAAKNRYSTYFISCHDLITKLNTAHQENRLKDFEISFIGKELNFNFAQRESFISAKYEL